MSLINIAPVGKVLFSSMSTWSTEKDSRDILLADNDRDFSFHTTEENCPWLIIDLLNEYSIKKIRIKNRLKVCQEKARTLRIEKLLCNSCSSSEILFDTTESWGQIIEIPVNNVKCRLLKFSLKEFSYFHLKHIEIFTDAEDLLYKHNNNDELSYCLTTLDSVFDCYIKTNYFDEIYFYTSDDKDKFPALHKYVKYRLINRESNYFLYCDVNMVDSNENLFSFLQIIGKKYQLSITANYATQIVTLSTKSIISLQDQTKILFNDLFEDLNIGIKSLTDAITVKFRNINNPSVIIDTDKLYDLGHGYADRLRGVLSLVESCKKLNINYFIKFTKPFNLNKYYSFKELSENDKNSMSNHSQCEMNIHCRISSQGLEDVLTVAKMKYEYITISSHVFHVFNDITANTFRDSFKKTEYFAKEYQKYKQIIGDDYVSVSLRFVNSLGDFLDTSSWNKTLDEDQQQYLMTRCKDELKNFINTKNFEKVLVLSDSTKFLNFVSDIPSVYVFPDFIAHLGILKSKSDENEKCFLKTLIDFHLIADAKESYRFQTEHLYPSGFPRLASVCANRKVIVHKFEL